MIQVLTGALLMSQMLADLTDDSDAGISYWESRCWHILLITHTVCWHTLQIIHVMKSWNEWFKWRHTLLMIPKLAYLPDNYCMLANLTDEHSCWHSFLTIRLANITEHTVDAGIPSWQLC
jgi:hypothetical protein